MVKKNQDKDFNDNKFIKSGGNTVNRGPTLDNEVVNKKYIDDELHKNTNLGFNQKYPLVKIHIILLNMIKYKSLTQLLLKMVIVVKLCCLTGNISVMIKITTEMYQTL